jgi:hypothetical protein
MGMRLEAVVVTRFPEAMPEGQTEARLPVIHPPREEAWWSATMTGRGQSNTRPRRRPAGARHATTSHPVTSSLLTPPP